MQLRLGHVFWISLLANLVAFGLLFFTERLWERNHAGAP
jgi:hypothetical protein